MFTEKIYPSYIAEADLDYYLSKGWYRMGQGIFTCHFLCFGERIYSAIWLRLDLKRHQFSKSQRKLFRKASSFRIEFNDFRVDEENEALYQKYRWFVFNGNISSSLEDSLLDGGTRNIYNSKECRIYDGDQLIAASYFDVGEDSIASILGMYDPDYAAYSLGYFTMLLEIDYGIKNGYSYYYPGYYVPGFKRFNYKARIGAVDYYSVTEDEWFPFDQLLPNQEPLQILVDKLTEMQLKLQQQKIQSQIFFYPFYETHLISYWEANYLKYPVLLWCQTKDGSADYLFLVYDLNLDCFIILKCELYSHLPSFLEDIFEKNNMDQPCFLEILTVRQRFPVFYSTETLAKALLSLSKMRRLK